LPTISCKTEFSSFRYRSMMFTTNYTNFTTTIPSYKAPLSYAYALYIVLGILAMLCNGLIFFLYARHKKKFKTSAFAINLSMADFSYGFLLVCSGSWRWRLWLLDLEHQKVTPVFCYVRLASLALFSVQTQSLALVAVAIERLVAVALPQWFFKNSKSGAQWYFVLGMEIYCVFSVLGTILKDVIVDPDRKMEAICFTPWVCCYGFQ